MIDPEGPEQTPHPAPAMPEDHPEIRKRRIGVLLVNLGTPDAPTPGAVRAYLAEFLSDPRVVDYPRALWLPLLYGVILNIRPARSAKAYGAIWRTDENESPLRYYTRRQADLSAARFSEAVVLDWAMRYGEPSVAERLTALKRRGCDRILVIPLYPQYSATTTASVHDAVFAAIARMRWQPALRIAPAFHDHPAYIKALASQLKTALAALDAPPERVLLSFHGLPERYLHEGDPYHCHCQKTARLLREAMRWTDEFAPITFQSRFGREKWLGPATDETLAALARAGVQRVAVAAPGFVSDCVETLEEIGIAARELFVENGGVALDALPCLNDGPEMIDLLETLIRGECSGWIE